MVTQSGEIYLGIFFFIQGVSVIAGSIKGMSEPETINSGDLRG